MKKNILEQSPPPVEYRITNNRLEDGPDGNYLIDLLVNGEIVLSGVYYPLAIEYIFNTIRDEDTFFEEEDGESTQKTGRKFITDTQRIRDWLENN